MGDLTGRGFGLVIAYLLPGFVLLLGVAELSPDVQAWLKTSAESESPTVGSFLYVLLASLTAGMTLGAFRWAIVDSVHLGTGVSRPRLDLRSLHERLPAYEALVDYYYRYYEFFSNTFLAVLASYTCWRVSASLGGPQLTDVGFLVLEIVFFAASRNTLQNFYERLGQTLGTLEGAQVMTNGGGKHDDHGTATSPRTSDKKSGAAQSSAQAKPAAKDPSAQPDRKK